MSEPLPHAPSAESALAIVCGAGSLPFALADAAARRGRRVVLFALRGWADPQRVAAYPHHWTWMGQFDRFMRLATDEGCRDIAFIGSVARPSLWKIRPDLRVLRLMPQIVRLYRGGDDHLQSGIGRLFEQYGFRLVGPREIAPELAMPLGPLGSRTPDERDRADIARGLALLNATSPYDIGQAVVVAENHVLAVEGPEGTDRMLARVAKLRSNGRIRSPMGTGVLIKAAKIGQDQRIDLPTIGPQTIEGAAAAGLSGIAVVAGSTIVAEPELIAAAADRAKLFVTGVDADGVALL
jgi:UDP-2,3-diacylglucosamine hydrolase